MKGICVRRSLTMLFVILQLGTYISHVIGQEDDDDIVTFELYSRRSHVRERLWPTDSAFVTSSSFDPCTKTVLFITGFLQGRDHPRITEAMEAMTRVSNYNVILVNYNTYRYLSAVEIAGRQIATFLERLSQTFSLDPLNIILWGVSLGSHVAGYASSIFRVGRITAIDPAGPVFDLLPMSMRLDRSDTEFLDVLHSSYGLGTMHDNIGHVNFIVGGGMFQSGCDYTVDSELKTPSFEEVIC